MEEEPNKIDIHAILLLIRNFSSLVVQYLKLNLSSCRFLKFSVHLQLVSSSSLSCQLWALESFTPARDRHPDSHNMIKKLRTTNTKNNVRDRQIKFQLTTL